MANDMQGQLMDLRNELDGIVDEAIPQKLDKPCKSIRATNEEVVNREMGGDGGGEPPTAHIFSVAIECTHPISIDFQFDQTCVHAV